MNKTIRDKSLSGFYCNLCIVMIWFVAIYSSVIQYVLFQVPYGLLIMGGMALLFYCLSNSEKPFVFREIMTDEDICMTSFMVYVFLVGIIFSPNRNMHVSQWIASMEYLLVQIMIASIIKKTGTDSIHNLLFVVSILLAIALLRNPINYQYTGRYTISEKVNPNGLGLGLVAGIWAILYRYLKKKQPLIFTGILVALLGYCVLLTGSRKSLIGAGLTIFLWLLFCFFPSLKEKDVKYGLVLFLIMVCIIIIVAYGFSNLYSNATIASRMDRLFYETTEGKRSNLYREGIELIKQNPIFGIGFHGFLYYFGGYSHATLVEVPVSGGIIGSVIYFSVFLLSLRKLLFIYRASKKSPEFYSEHKRIKMLLILWIVMAFYMICIIHPYQFDSSICFGIIFGETAYIQGKLNLQYSGKEKYRMGSKYIRYE